MEERDEEDGGVEIEEEGEGVEIFGFCVAVFDGNGVLEAIRGRHSYSFRVRR